METKTTGGRLVKPSSNIKKDAVMQLPTKHSSISTNNVLEQLENIPEQDPGQHFDLLNAEMLWLQMGMLCTRDDFPDDSGIELMFNLIERARLFDCIFLILIGIRSTDLSVEAKRNKVEQFLKSVCYTIRTIQMVSTSNNNRIIGPNFFQELNNFIQSEKSVGLHLSDDVMNIISRTQQLLDGKTEIQGPKEEVDDGEIEAESNYPVQPTVQFEPPNDMFSISVVPTYEDVVNESPLYLRPNIIKGFFPDLETYLDIHFRLLLEDFMTPLRQGFAQVQRGETKRIPSVRIYEKVRFDSSLVNLRNVIPERTSSWKCCWIRFEPLPYVHWAISKRLIHGSLVCLWDPSSQDPDGFIVGTVAMSKPEYLANGRLVVALATENLPQDFLRREYIMIESVVFYEPYRAVLEALQAFNYDNFPFLPYILGFETKPYQPDYLKNCQRYFVDTLNSTSTVYDVANSRSWPSAHELGLDGRQHEAFIHALTSRLSLIQGPPGTGKTYLGLRIVQSLLRNKPQWYGELTAQNIPTMSFQRTSKRNRQAHDFQNFQLNDQRSPIVVICYTNHALDQFLEGIHETTDRIVRIGGQSKSPILKKCSLSETKQRFKKSKAGQGSAYAYFHHHMKALQKPMTCTMRDIQKIMKVVHGEELRIEDLVARNVISHDVYNLLFQIQKRLRFTRKDNILHWWLGFDNFRLLLRLARELRIVVDVPSPWIEEPCPGNMAQPEDFQLDISGGRDEDDDDLSSSDDEEDDEESKSTEKSESGDEDADQVQDVLQSVLANQDADPEEREMSRFLLDQSERKKLIINHLLSLPTSDIQVEAYQIPSLPHVQRWQLFNLWKMKYQSMVEEELHNAQEAYKELIERYNYLKAQAEAALCRNVDVIGLTTTGAAKKRRFLESLKAKIVIVEEAAEVLESHIVCSLTGGCQQLIMIGDHQQLRPSVNVYQLAKQFHLDVSLFERLAMGGMEPKVLGVQHRMRPEIARLISPSIYQNLENHPSVNSFPDVTGMAHNVFFLHHQLPEQKDRDGSSFSNIYEARMALGLARYLIQQGMDPTRITILAAYAGQLHLLTRLRNEMHDPQLKVLQITVVDNFQGEENDVIILSLVRNNFRNSVGFLRIANRVCVALSRARHGLYMMGNMFLLSRSSSLWSDVQVMLGEKSAIGMELVLRCDVHHEVYWTVSNPDGFPATRNFCSQVCGVPLKCEHPCRLKCHQGRPHMKECREQVSKKLPCGHSIVQLCSENPLTEPCHTAVAVRRSCGHVWNTLCNKATHPSPADKCRETVMKALPCGHLQEIECCIPIDTYICLERVAWKMSCDHSVQVKCGSPLSERLKVLCTEKVRKRLACGHVRPMLCFQDATQQSCTVLSETVLNCSHLIQYECTGEPIEKQGLKCLSFVTVQLPCGHEQYRMCSSPNAPCKIQMPHHFPCGHLNVVDCWERYTAKCGTLVAKTLTCGHQVELPCSAQITEILCQQMVKFLHPLCHHMQNAPCFLSRNEFAMRNWKCETQVEKMLSCSHFIVVACNRDTYGLECTAETDKQLPCGHVVVMACNQSIDGVECEAIDLKSLPCGHEIGVRCNQDLASRKCPCPCAAELECGHFCPRDCHGPAPQHINTCQVLVSKTLKCGHVAEMICSRNPSSETCHYPVKFVRDCGHDVRTTCGLLALSGDDIDQKCKVKVEKVLQCGHRMTVDCGTEEIVCTVPVEQVLGCRHTIQTQCGIPLEKRLEVGCSHVEMKTRTCGHNVEVRCGTKRYEQDIEQMFCRVKVKKLLECGHEVHTDCSRKITPADCTLPCSKTLDCGHPCQLKCNELCSSSPCSRCLSGQPAIKSQGGRGVVERCAADRLYRAPEKNVAPPGRTKKVEKVIPECGHSIWVERNRTVTRHDCTSPCSKILDCGHACSLPCCRPCDPAACSRCQRKAESKGENDRKRCQEKLDCNHKCPRYADECAADLFHGICTQICKRQLVCGHKCSDRCCKACPPCKLKCDYACIHQQKCSYKCGDSCKPCEKPCAWKCPHNGCNHSCFEYCNRDPCDRICNKKLKCGHKCGYLCGEICPTKCIQCSKIIDYNPRQRYIYLRDCDHSISVEVMDDWIKSESVRPVKAPSCPKCSAVIRVCHRYGDYIKSFYEDVTCVKESVCRFNLDIRPKLQTLVRQLESERMWSEQASWADHCHQVIQMNHQLKSNPSRLGNIDTWDLYQRARVLWLLQSTTRDVHKEYSINVSRKSHKISIRSTLVPSIENKLAAVWASAVKYKHFSAEYYTQLVSEVRRIELYRQWCVLESVPSEFLADQRRLLKDIGRKLESDEMLDEDEEENFVMIMSKAATPLHLDLLDKGYPQLDLRLGMNRSDWFKCPGHETVFSKSRDYKCPCCTD